jgi:predicted enzyme related to lactoylglutathione lyase
MRLSDSRVICFIPSTNLEIAAIFYTEKLNLELTKTDAYALEYDLNQATLRITRVSEKSKASYTVLGWQVEDINFTVDALKKNGIEFIFYDGMPQDDNGICTFPGGGKVAWFKDPDDNILSITQNQ